MGGWERREKNVQHTPLSNLFLLQCVYKKINNIKILKK